jgi:hypothetical protein
MNTRGRIMYLGIRTYTKSKFVVISATPYMEEGFQHAVELQRRSDESHDQRAPPRGHPGLAGIRAHEARPGHPPFRPGGRRERAADGREEQGEGTPTEGRGHLARQGPRHLRRTGPRGPLRRHRPADEQARPPGRAVQGPAAEAPAPSPEAGDVTA